MKIFPLLIRPKPIGKGYDKIPLVKWKTEATSDVAKHGLWSNQLKGRMNAWGFPTGQPNNVIVLDLDVSKGGLDHNLILPPTFVQETVTGGRHYIYQYPNDGQDYRNKVDVLPGVDVEGKRGYGCLV